MKLYEIVYEKKYSWPREWLALSAMTSKCHKWPAWQIRVTNVVGQRVESVWIS